MKFNPRTWAESVWRTSAASWVDRTEQDFNYRDYLILPVLENFVHKYASHIKPGTWVDFGCGEGRETAILHRLLGKVPGLKMIGVDFQKVLIDKAKALYGKKRITFLQLPKDVHRIPKNLSGASSLFVLQDTPDAEKIIHDISAKLRPGALFASIVILPKFAEAMRKKGAVKRVHKSSDKRFDWCGEYPIAETNREPFYAPYFQRSLVEYLKMHHTNGLDLFHFETIKPDTNLLARAKREKLSPFYNHKYNVYWPEIANQPSTFLIVGQKRQNF